MPFWTEFGIRTLFFSDDSWPFMTEFGFRTRCGTGYSVMMFRHLAGRLWAVQTRFDQRKMAAIMAHGGVVFYIVEHFAGGLADSPVFTQAGIRYRIKEAGVEHFRIAERQGLIVLSIDIPPHPPFIIPHAFTEAEPAGYSQHKQDAAYRFP